MKTLSYKGQRGIRTETEVQKIKNNDNYNDTVRNKVRIKERMFFQILLSQFWKSDPTL